MNVEHGTAPGAELKGRCRGADDDFVAAWVALFATHAATKPPHWVTLALLDGSGDTQVGTKVVASLSAVGKDPPPVTVTWLINCAGTKAPTLTVTVIGG